MRITAHERKSPSVRTLLAALAVLATSAASVDPAAAQLLNPAFDSGPVGPVGNFGTVVGPPFSAGFWGAEDADILGGNVCTAPRTYPYLLQLNVGGGSYSQAWQAVDVTSSPPAFVSLSAWSNTCIAGAGSVVGVAIRTFSSANGWPSHTLYVNQNLTLDGDTSTWQEVAMECVAIPAGTQWIVAEVYLANTTSNGIPAAFDDVELVLDPHCSVPTQPTTWGKVKSLYR